MIDHALSILMVQQLRRRARGLPCLEMVERVSIEDAKLIVAELDRADGK